MAGYRRNYSPGCSPRCFFVVIGLAVANFIHGQGHIQNWNPPFVEIDSAFGTKQVNDRIMVHLPAGTIPFDISYLAENFNEGLHSNTSRSHVLIGRAYDKPAALLYLPLVNASDQEQDMIIDADHNRCDTLEAYLLHTSGHVDALGVLYRGLPLEHRIIPLRTFAIPFRLKPYQQATLVLLSKRTTGIHELDMTLSQHKSFIIKNNEQDLVRFFALFSAFFFVFAVFSLGLTFRHRLLFLFGVYILPIAIGQLNFNYFFDQVVYPAGIGLNADTVGIFIIFATNCCFHAFGGGYLRNLGIFRKWHRQTALVLAVANLIPMVLLLTTLTPLVNKFVTDASLVLTTLNIFWLFYIAILGYTKRRSHYLLVVTVLVFVPFLYRSYLSSSPSLDLTWFQPGYFLLLFGYLIVSLFRGELTSRQYAEKEIQRVYRELDQVRLGEIQHIGRNLHDQLGNTLASALGYLNMRKPNIALSKAMILDAISETRLISHNLVKNDDRPLTEKLEALTDRFNDFSSIDFVFHDFTDKKIDLVPGIKQQSIYLIVQEVLNNVVRHSQANETMIQSLIVDDHLRVSIEDDGIGFDRTAVPNGIGITNMYKRADIAALRLHINGGPGGTLINIDLDYEAQGL